jgi:anti-sigma B factor antagonist
VKPFPDESEINEAIRGASGSSLQGGSGDSQHRTQNNSARCGRDGNARAHHDGSDSQKIEWGLAQLLKGSQKKVIFDLSDVCYVDSSGVGILMMCYAKLKKAGGALYLVGAQGMVEDALVMTSVNKIVPFYPTTKETAEDFQLV